MEPKTVNELQQMGYDRCADCNAHEPVIYLNQKCHPKCPTQTYIDFVEKVAVVECTVCKRKVVMLKLQAEVV